MLRRSPTRLDRRERSRRPTRTLRPEPSTPNCHGTRRAIDCPILRTGGDLASTWVAKPEVHAEVRDTS